MNSIKKIIVFVPVLVISCMYAYSQQFQQFFHASSKKQIALVAGALLFFIWVIMSIRKRKQESFFDILVQSSFYVYIFSVLTLTGYFVLFNHVSTHGWWNRVEHRVSSHDGVNLTPFLFLKARHLFTYDVVGNFFMLLPLGIYLPLLYRHLKNFFTVTFVAMLVSVSIELMQLSTNFRITDVDDVVLNTAGAAVGFILYFLIHALVGKPSQGNGQYQMSS